MPVPVEIAPGDQPLEIDDYVVIEEIGRGAMKIVFRATNRHTGSDVALAILKHRYPNAELKARFKRESELMQRLKHPNIVSVEKSGDSEGQPFLAMENVGGGTIADQLLFGTADMQQIASWMLPICDAIQYAHDAGTIHRDLKPENVLLTDEGVPKIADFGLAKAAAQDEPLTQVGQALGTLHYVSPEQLCGNQVTTASDIYSLGVTLFEMLVGRKQFLQITKTNQFGGIAAGIEKRRAESSNTSEQAFFDICNTCMMTDPAKRFLSAKLLSNAIQSVIDSEPAEDVELKPVDSSVLKRGYVVGNAYALEIPLDQGAMGEVWRASASDHAHKVVVKFMSTVHRHNQTEVDRFRDSFRIVGAIHHENICPLYAMGTDPKAGIYVVMKFHEGITLAQYCQRKRSQGKFFTVHEVCKILYPIARALDHSHKHNVLHRDVKPANIIVSETNEELVPILIDFGLAELIQATNIGESNLQPPSGTYRYIAPEAWAGKALQASSDQYALGIVAYEMLSGKPPFSDVPGMQLSHCVQYNPVPSLTGLSETVNRVLNTALKKQPKERFGSCVDFIEALDPATHPSTITKPPVQKSRLQRMNRWQVAIALLLGCFILAFSVYPLSVLGPLPRPPQPIVDTDTSEKAVERGEFLLAKGSYEKAIVEYNQAIKLDPLNDQAFFSKGVAELRLERFDDAIQSFTLAIKLNGRNDVAHIERGLALSRQGRQTEAIADFKSAIGMNTNNPDAHLYLANLYQQQDRLDESIAEYDQAVVIDPKNEAAFYGKGVAELKLGLSGDALASLTNAIEISPTRSDAFLKRASIFKQRELFEKAIADLKSSMALDPDNIGIKAMIEECESELDLETSRK